MVQECKHFMLTLAYQQTPNQLSFILKCPIKLMDGQILYYPQTRTKYLLGIKSFYYLTFFSWLFYSKI